MTIMLAYPIAYIYNQKYVIQQPNASREARNTYILLSGLALAFFFNSFEIIHSLITIAVSYYICYITDRFYHNRRVSALLVWIFNLLYLMIGYYFYASDGYDIGWTTTQCVLCLRLLGFSMDFMDGAIMKDNKTTPSTMKSSEKKISGPHSFPSDSPLEKLPKLKDVYAYCFFPSAFLIGPQFSFSLYNRFLSSTGPYNRQKIVDKKALMHTKRAQKNYINRCLMIGIIYIILLQTIGAIYPTSYILTPEFSNQSFLKKLVEFWICGKMVFVKYVGVWLLTEGACTYFGITYQEGDENTAPSFSGLANSRPLEFELSTSIEHLVPNFNINTNLWVKHYVFKRLRFLGNKDLSQLGALLFLAIWHGFHFNYFQTFLLEFLFVVAERIIRARFYVPFVKPWIDQDTTCLYAWKLIAWLTATTCFNYAIVGFDLLTLARGIKAYNQIYWLIHLLTLFVFIVHLTIGKKKLSTK
ncbi:MBOAT, membrane-bound O-acyltransferase family-domain-containing protein [Cokeromyces recurvatus]|uniref:MBOAT, membrane-bound O-acyltransferase family-domain-containing protein n=1 Tax=Cokeromyces recurvatus TaxID=90255 RepID=UPI0022205CDE|nr:MBOAT, membrane-bound O-acyltransferase family-domain-containing protein [Cokeromyces recurvatus]KAI7906541.1 MBOAT, membrane-bound O-acyltransferase family-domain-containing protein [Cokeromyces recurvatus]